MLFSLAVLSLVGRPGVYIANGTRPRGHNTIVICCAPHRLNPVFVCLSTVCRTAARMRWLPVDSLCRTALPPPRSNQIDFNLSVVGRPGMKFAQRTGGLKASSGSMKAFAGQLSSNDIACIAAVGHHRLLSDFSGNGESSRISAAVVAGVHAAHRWLRAITQSSCLTTGEALSRGSTAPGSGIRPVTPELASNTLFD